MLIVRCMKDGLDGIKKGEEKQVKCIEECRYSFEVDEDKRKYYDPKDFEIVRADRYMYNDAEHSRQNCCIAGKDYIVLGEEEDMYSVVDESGDDYLYPMDCFVEVDEDGD